MSAAVLNLEPGSADWLKFMTASKVAAVLGVSTYDSPRSMWHKMHGDVPPEPPKKNQSRGHYLEPAVLNWFFDQHPDLYAIRKPGTFIHDNGWAAVNPDALSYNAETGLTIPVEAKSDAGDNDDWGTPGTDEIPVYYAAQCIWTAHVLGAPRVYLPMITARLEFREYVVEHNEALAHDIERKCRLFLDSLAAAQPPPLDDHPATFDSLKRVNPSITDTEVQLTTDQAQLYIDAVTGHRASEKQLNYAKSTIAEAMGTAKKAYHGNDLIARRQNTASGIAALYAAKTFPTIPERSAAA